MFNLSIASPSTTSCFTKAFCGSSKSSFNGVQLRGTCSFQSFSPIKLSRLPSSSVVMMAKRDEELKEIRAKTTQQINEEIVDLKGDLLMLRFQKSARNEFKASEFRRMRKRVALMLTVRREREIEEGIGKRLSRKLDRKWKKSIVVKASPGLIKIREQEAAEAAEKGDS